MSIVVRSNEKPVAEPSPQQSGDAKATASKGAAPSALEAQASEQKETETPEASDEAGNQEENETETTDEDGEGSDKENEEADKAPKKKGGFQRRIDKLNAAKAAAQQEAEYWKREALKSATAPKGDAPKAEPAQATTTGKPTPDAFETHAEYVEALTDWKVDQKERAREEKAQKAQLETEVKAKAQTYAERARAYAATKPDFEEVLSEVDGIALSPALQEIILSSENGPALAYELAKDPDEFARVCKLAPLSAAREMGRIESRMASREPKETKPEPKKLTNAPKPLEPVKAGKGSAAKSISDANLSYAEYERLRREQINKRR